jgi:hypothetical protein
LVLAPVLTPFLIAALLAYMFSPPITRSLARAACGHVLLFVTTRGHLLVLWLPHAQQSVPAGKLVSRYAAAQASPWLQSRFEQAACLISMSSQQLDHWREVGTAAVKARDARPACVAGWLRTCAGAGRGLLFTARLERHRRARARAVPAIAQPHGGLRARPTRCRCVLRGQLL